jgi:hypothetical protein
MRGSPRGRAGRQILVQYYRAAILTGYWPNREASRPKVLAAVALGITVLRLPASPAFWSFQWPQGRNETCCSAAADPHLSGPVLACMTQLSATALSRSARPCAGHMPPDRRRNSAPSRASRYRQRTLSRRSDRLWPEPLLSSETGIFQLGMVQETGSWSALFTSPESASAVVKTKTSCMQTSIFTLDRAVPRDKANAGQVSLPGTPDHDRSSG